MFLSMLELVQQNYMNILIGEGRNNFIVEFNPDRPDDPVQVDFSENESGSRRQPPVIAVSSPAPYRYKSVL
jgi:hypothetical protein